MRVFSAWLVLALVVAVSARPCNLTGVNLAGGEFASGDIPGAYNSDYTYPTKSNADYFINKGMNVFRIPFNLERVFKGPGGSLILSELARLDGLVNYITLTKEKYVLLDPHAYGRMFGGKVGESAVPISVFADFWFKLSQYYKTNPRVIFGLINEPNGQSAEVWSRACQAAIYAIRKAGANQLILVPATSWSGAHSWVKSNSAFYMKNITDPIDNFAFELHQYFDSDSSGTHNSCESATVGASRLSVFTNWARPLGKRGFLGEFGGGKNDVCFAAIDNAIQHMDDNNQVWLGWTYWAGGPWWKDDYFSVLQPNKTGIDRPQMPYVEPHINKQNVTLPLPTLPSALPDYPKIVTEKTPVYVDGLVSPYQDYSWARRNQKNSTYVHSGQYSFEFEMNSAYAGLRFNCPSGCFSNSQNEYLTLDFYYMSPTGSSGANKINVQLRNASHGLGSINLINALEKSPAPYEWVRGSVSVLKYTKNYIFQIQFASSSSGVLPVMFLDDISLVSYNDSFAVVVGSPGTTTTSAPTSSATAAPTLAPTAKPTAKSTASPTLKPTARPTLAATTLPTSTPTAAPTLAATPSPTPAPSPVGSGLRGNYFSGSNFTSLAATRIDAKVDFNWGTQSPGVGNLSSDNFSIRWTGSVLSEYTANYTFYVRSDDGCRLWINGVLVISNWVTQGITTKSGVISLVAGQKNYVRLEYFDSTKNAAIFFSWSSPLFAQTIIPTSRLFPAAEKYLGCFRDQSNPRDLDYKSQEIDGMTIPNCKSRCTGRNYAYWGVQNGKECRCGNSYGRYGQVADSECNVPCGGNPADICGGGYRNSIYTTLVY